MKNYDVVIVGGSAAGVTAGVTARKHYPGKSILLIKNVQNVPIPCGIPYIFGTVGDPMKNILPTDSMMTANKIDVLQDEVVKINREFKLVMTRQGESVGYDRLLLAVGSEPVVPPLPGVGLPGVFPIIKDAAYLATLLDAAKKAEDIVIIGGGFIGVEMAEELKKLRPEAHISIVEMLPHCLGLVYDSDFSMLAEKALVDEGIALITGATAEAIIGPDKVQGVKLGDGRTLPADVVVLGIGSRANTRLAIDAGLKIGPAKGIAVDRRMVTSDENILACGDCADKWSYFDHEPSPLKLASIATAESRIAGANLFSAKRVNEGVIGVFSTQIGKKTFAAAGLTEREAIRKGFRTVMGEAEAVNRHPGSMPGGEAMRVRLMFEAASGLLLGGQVYGAASGGELINVVGAMIAKKTTADEMVLFQAGTHPALTASPVVYQLVNAAEAAYLKMKG